MIQRVCAQKGQTVETSEIILLVAPLVVLQLGLAVYALYDIYKRGGSRAPLPDPEIEKLIEAEEGASNRLSGGLAHFITVVAVAASLFHLYAAYDVVSAQVLRPVHVGVVLFLSFLLFPMASRFRHRVRWWDWLLAALSVVVTVYILSQGEELGERAVTPNTTDYVMGVALVALLLEGATVPFIARYRKEATGGLDEVQIRAIEERREHAWVVARHAEGRRVDVARSTGTLYRRLGNPGRRQLVEGHRSLQIEQGH